MTFPDKPRAKPVRPEFSSGPCPKHPEWSLEAVAAKGISERELQKAKNRVRSMFVFGLQSNLSRAMMLSSFELYWGDANLLKAELDAYLKVSAEDVKRVAGSYFAPTNRTVLNVVTTETDAAKGDAK